MTRLIKLRLPKATLAKKFRRDPASVGRGLKLTRKQLLPLLGLAAILGLSAVLGIGSYREGGLLTVSRLEVSGNRHWSASQLLECAGLEVGQRLHEVPFRAARRNLERLPGIESASIRYVPGGRLRVEVRESDVVAIQNTGRSSGKWRGLTPGGEWMPLSDGAAIEDAPILEARGLSRVSEKTVAFFLAGVRSRHPDLFAGFSQVALARGENTEADVYWRDGSVKLRLDYADASLRSLEFFRELLRRERGSWPEGATVDLRVEGYAYVL